jgi:hypothetical protein
MRQVGLTIVLFAVFAGTAAASSEQITKAGVPYATPALAVDDTGSVVAVLYRTRSGIRVRISRGGGRFGRARLVSRHRGDAVGGMRLAVTPAGRVLAAWERDDGTEPADPDSRDDGGCCTRIHAAVLAPSGRRSGPRRLSPAGVSATLFGIAIGAEGVAVSWRRGVVNQTWEVRSGRALARLRSRRVLLRSFVVIPGALRWLRGRLTAVGGTLSRAEDRTRVRVLATGPRGWFRSAGRSVVARTGAFAGTFSIAASGDVTALLDTSGRSLLITGNPSVLKVAAGPPRARLAASSSGAGLLVGTAYFGIRGRVRVKPPGGALGPSRRLRLARRQVFDTDVVPSVGLDGRGAVWSRQFHRRRSSIYFTPVSAGGQPGTLRRVRRYRDANTSLHAAAVDRRGPLALVSSGRRLDVLRP